MKAIFALLFIAFAATSFAAKSKNPTESKLVNALKGLMQVADDDEVEQVADVLSSVYDEIEGVLNKIRTQRDADAQTAQDTTDAYNSNIDSLNEGIDANQAVADEASADASALQSQIDASLGAISQATDEQDDETNRRAIAHQQNVANQKSLQAAIDAANDALTIIRQVEDENLEGSFLEISHKKVAKNFASVSEAVSNLKLRSPVVPIIKMLVEITQDQLNTDFFPQIEDLLAQLIATLQQELDDSVAADNADAEFSANTLQTLQDTIDTETDSANNNQALLSQAEATLGVASDTVAALSLTLQASQDALAAFTDAADAANARQNGIINRLKADLAALEQAETFVQDNE